MHREFTTPRTLSTLHPSRLRGALSLALGAALLAACADDDADDAVPDDAFAETLPEPPQLTAEELAALRAEVTIASLPVGGAGTVDIVDTGAPDAPALVYVAAGGGGVTEVLRQLIAEQHATPAEVFLALADAGAALPERLLVDHRARAGREPGLGLVPRRLDVVMPRNLEIQANECLGSGGNPQTFDSWVDDWWDRFGHIQVGAASIADALNNAGGATAYYVGSDSEGRALSACNAADNDAGVSYWRLTTIPGSLYYPYSYVWAATLSPFKAAHLYSTGADLPYRMIVHHTHPDPETYVAYGRCGAGCP